MIILFDTNILLDVLQNRIPFYDDSARAWNLAEQKAISGFVSMISFNNAFYVLRKQVGSSQALDAMKAVRRVFGCVTFDESLLDLAIVKTSNDLEDAIQAASADRVQADHIVTRNPQDFRALGVSAIAPQELRALLGA